MLAHPRSSPFFASRRATGQLGTPLCDSEVVAFRFPPRSMMNRAADETGYDRRPGKRPPTWSASGRLFSQGVKLMTPAVVSTDVDGRWSSGQDRPRAATIVPGPLEPGDRRVRFIPPLRAGGTAREVERSSFAPRPVRSFVRRGRRSSERDHFVCPSHKRAPRGARFSDGLREVVQRAILTNECHGRALSDRRAPSRDVSRTLA